jgi:hypothetical protein
MISSEVQWLMVETRSTILVPGETTGKAVEQYQPITIKQVAIWAFELYNQLTADLVEINILVSESIVKLVNVQQAMLHLVDGYMLMMSKQNTFYDSITKGVETFYHTV